MFNKTVYKKYNCNISTFVGFIVGKLTLSWKSNKTREWFKQERQCMLTLQ